MPHSCLEWYILRVRKHRADLFRMSAGLLHSSIQVSHWREQGQSFKSLGFCCRVGHCGAQSLLLSPRYHLVEEGGWRFVLWDLWVFPKQLLQLAVDDLRAALRIVLRDIGVYDDRCGRDLLHTQIDDTSQSYIHWFRRQNLTKPKIAEKSIAVLLLMRCSLRFDRDNFRDLRGLSGWQFRT